MNALIIYIIKVSIIQALFYGGYHMLFRRSGKHVWNRYYILMALIMSLVVPLVETRAPPVLEPAHSEHVISWIQEAADSYELVPLRPADEYTFSWWKLIPILYILVVLLLFLRSIIYLNTLFELQKRTAYIDKKWFRLFKTTQLRSFSFFSNVFIPHSLFDSKDFDQILAHECVHVKQWHSLDRLLMDFLVSLFWFNPFIYLYRNALIEIHEYQADEAVINQFQDAIGYQEVLYSQLQHATYSNLVSHFNFSMIKKRIVMINKQKNKRVGFLYLMLLPLIATVTLAFSSKETVAPITQVGNELANRLVPQRFDFENFKIPFRQTAQSSDIPSISPVKSGDQVRLTSGFGMRMHPLKKVEKMHLGVDFSCKIGTEILATADGVVQLAEMHAGGYGKRVVIQHNQTFTTSYAQLSDFKVQAGDRVVKGQVIALSGSSGASTGPHLHYEVMKNGEHVDPLDYIKDHTFSSEVKHENRTDEGVFVADHHHEDEDQSEQAAELEQALAQERKALEEERHLLEMERAMIEDEKQRLREQAEDERIATGINQEQTTRIRIDGFGSKQLDFRKTPLYVLDGKHVENLEKLSPNDISSITVLKGERAIQRYGDPGQHGVIEVVTKRKNKIKEKDKTKKKDKHKATGAS